MSDKVQRDTVTVTDNSTGRSIDLPILRGTHGLPVVDTRRIHPDLGMFTYDPGFKSTASCSSEITFIDGDAGLLMYRGYRIEDLVESSCYLEVCYLLLYGELPTAAEFDNFRQMITMHTMVNEGLKDFMRGFRYDAHPMAILVGVVGALGSFFHDSLNIHDARHQEISAHRLIAKMPTIAASAFRYSRGEPFIYPRNKFCYAENFLHMMFAYPTYKYEVDPDHARILDKLLILHADHEQNASTSTVRLAGSSLANPFAAVSAGIGALWGPAHGGANEAVIKMLEQIGTPQEIPRFIERAKDKDDPFRLMGFGHRVYRNYDPRAKIIRGEAHALLAKHARLGPLFETALELERVALEDDYFLERKLYPNVDFYSGLIYRALGIPTSMFTVLFAMARTIGWIAQWKEMINDPERVIGRPRQLYTGPAERTFVPRTQRGHIPGKTGCSGMKHRCGHGRFGDNPDCAPGKGGGKKKNK
jgi:citrate synthase